MSQLNAGGKPFTTINIDGKVVEVRQMEYTAYHAKKKCVYYNAYVELPNSQHLTNGYLGCATYREGDWIGVDSNHASDMNRNQAEKLASALTQIELVIGAWKAAMDPMGVGA